MQFELLKASFVFSQHGDVKALFDLLESLENVAKHPQFLSQLIGGITVNLLLLREVPPDRSPIRNDLFVAGRFLLHLEIVRRLEIESAGCQVRFQIVTKQGHRPGNDLSFVGYAEAGYDIGRVAEPEAVEEGRSILTERLDRALTGRGFADSLSTQLARADLKLTVAEFLAMQVIGVVGGIAVAYILFGGGILLPAAAGFSPCNRDCDISLFRMSWSYVIFQQLKVFYYQLPLYAPSMI